MILHYSLPILKDNDNALSLLFFSNANTLSTTFGEHRFPDFWTQNTNQRSIYRERNRKSIWLLPRQWIFWPFRKSWTTSTLILKSLKKLSFFRIRNLLYAMNVVLVAGWFKALIKLQYYHTIFSIVMRDTHRLYSTGTHIN